MRSLSASADRALVSICVLFFAGCARHGAPPPLSEPLLALEGGISLSGGAIDSHIILSDDGGAICRLEGGPLEIELRALDGLSVRITGRLAGRTGEIPEFLVDRYELLPVGGFAPIVGRVESNNGVARIVDSRGDSYRLAGPLAKALLPFGGYKIWVAGRMRQEDGGGAREMLVEVESYGVLLPPGSIIRSP